MLFVFGAVVLVASPFFVTLEIQESVVPWEALGSCANGSRIFLPGQKFDVLVNIDLWIVGIVFKFVPCLLLAFFLTQVICMMVQHGKRRLVLFQ